MCDGDSGLPCPQSIPQCGSNESICTQPTQPHSISDHSALSGSPGVCPARSLLPKFNELQLITAATSPSIICITESWLCSDILDSEISLPDYQLVRFDRNRNGGGVLMYISVDLHFSVLSSPVDLELLTVVVSKQLCKACISLFYRPPNSPVSILDTLCTYLESLTVPQFSNFILLGDFNINFCTHSGHPLFSKLESLQGGSRLVLSIHIDQVLFLPTTNWLTNISSNADVSTAGLQSSSGQNINREYRQNSEH